MKAFLDKLRSQVKEFFGKLNRKEKIRLLILSILIITFSIVMAVVLGRTSYAVLYSGLQPAQSAEVIAALDEQGVPYQTQGTGTILVPEDQVSLLKIQLSNTSFNTNNLGTEYISQGSGFGMTETERNAFLKYQDQENIRTLIQQMEPIESCYVLISLPEKSSFAVAPNQTPASASVMVKVRGGNKLSQSEVAAIASVVQGALPGIAQENINIVDANMNTYNVASVESGSGAVEQQFALREQLRANLETQVMNLLAPVYGTENIRTSVNVTLNFDKELVDAVEFTPVIEAENSGIAVSASNLYEAWREDGYAIGSPGGDTEGLNNPEYPYNIGDDEQYYTKVLEETNYEINESRTQIERAQGSIQDLSIAVLVNSESGVADYSTEITELVSRAIGVANDLIAVTPLPFTAAASQFDQAMQAEADMQAQLARNEWIKRGITMAGILIIALLIFLLIRQFAQSAANARAYEQQLALAAAGGNIDLIAGDEGEESFTEIDINAKPEGVEQIEKFIEKDPQAVAQLLRNWLSDEYR